MVDPAAASAPAATAVVERATPVLQAERISMRFGGVAALDGVDLQLHAGEICGVMGPNGAGKSTLFDVISGVRRPTSGRVHLAGHDVSRTSAVGRARRGLHRTFQRQQTFGWLTVEENVLVALETLGGGGGLPADLVHLPTRTRRERARRERADEVLERCGLTDAATVPAGNLDIGRARALEVARAIAVVPSVFLLDEPTSGLEHRQADELAAILDGLRADGCAIALVEHDVDFMFRHCSRIVVLNLGRVIADGAPEQIRADPDVAAAYLG